MKIKLEHFGIGLTLAPLLRMAVLLVGRALVMSPARLTHSFL